MSKEPKETHTVVYKNKDCVVKIIHSHGWHSPADTWFDQEDDEIAFVICGNAQIEFIDKKIALGTGDSIALRAHKKHRVCFTSPDCVWLCVFTKNKKIKNDQNVNQST